ncbi:uncharacterized protein I303_100868 [Kwoniella dejecticola CBS 10117]|uniref:Uncharacterized protein n=1 Tax=Kwoniella dejecticola CBS 10117 TaxID=1296121 RepID=A0A1A6AG63_9TREE|nr:uncharacterized protein I303_00871 [Kwoniella dejecticola CBS 10117]OBR89049.1 hypothetical protein I303_00871 [Kwoniella dejecticola CBS 10117]
MQEVWAGASSQDTFAELETIRFQATQAGSFRYLNGRPLPSEGTATKCAIGLIATNTDTWTRKELPDQAVEIHEENIRCFEQNADWSKAELTEPLLVACQIISRLQPHMEKDSNTFDIGFSLRDQNKYVAIGIPTHRLHRHRKTRLLASLSPRLRGRRNPLSRSMVPMHLTKSDYAKMESPIANEPYLDDILNHIDVKMISDDDKSTSTSPRVLSGTCVLEHEKDPDRYFVNLVPDPESPFQTCREARVQLGPGERRIDSRRTTSEDEARFDHNLHTLRSFVDPLSRAGATNFQARYKTLDGYNVSVKEKVHGGLRIWHANLTAERKPQ